MDVSVIIVTYNSAKFIPACFESFARFMQGINYEIIVVDNKSSDSTLAIIRERWPEVRIIENNFNAGFAAANNQGACIARGDYLFLLNADTEILDNGIEKALRFARANNIAILGPKTFGPGRILLKTWKEFNSLYFHMADLLSGALLLNRYFNSGRSAAESAPRLVKFLTGSAMLISKNAYQRLGLFDEQFFFSGEERDLCMRFTTNGEKLSFFPDWSILHYVGHGESVSPFHYINWVKSSLKLARKHKGVLGYGLMVITLGIYSTSSALQATYKQMKAGADMQHRANNATACRRLLYWFLGLMSEEKAMNAPL